MIFDFASEECEKNMALHITFAFGFIESVVFDLNYFV